MRIATSGKFSRYSLPVLVLLAILAMLGIANPSIARAANSQVYSDTFTSFTSVSRTTVPAGNVSITVVSSSAGAWTGQALCSASLDSWATVTLGGGSGRGSGFGSGSYPLSLNCPSPLYVIGFLVTTTGYPSGTNYSAVDKTTPVMKGEYDFADGNPSLNPSGNTACGSGTFSDLKASYVNGNVWVSWRWIGADSDSLSYPQFWVGNASETTTYRSGAVYTAPAGVIASHASDGYYMQSPTPSSGVNPGASVHLYFMKNASTFLCLQTIVPSTSTQITPGPSNNSPTDYGASTDPDTGSSCSGFDIFCRLKAAIKWAFVPSAATQTGWTTKINDLKNNPPISTVTQAYNLTSDVYTAYNTDTTSTSGDQFGTCTGGATSTNINTTGNCIVSIPLYDEHHNRVSSLPLLSGAGDQMQNTFIGHCIWWALTAMITCSFGMYWFKTVTGSVGNRGD